jgi:hypothetical protein
MFGLFKRNQPESIKNEPDAEDSSDAEDSADAVAAMFIKAKCDAGRLVVGLMLDPAEDRAEQIGHYKNIRNECMEHVEKVQDEFYRGFALNHIIAMCVAAGDISVARALLVAVQDDFLRERIFESSPVLRDT